MIRALLLAGSVVLAQGHAKLDPCTGAIPSHAADAVKRVDPKYRLPLSSDSLPEDVAMNRQQGGTGCLLVSVGNFTGAGKKDYALVLRSAGGQSVRVVGAYQRSETWRVDTLAEWGDDVRPYVELIGAGSYGSIADIPGPGEEEEPGHVRHVDSVFPGILTGTIEASGVAYCHVKGKWIHVWLSD